MTILNRQDIKNLKVGDRIRVAGNSFYDNAEVVAVYPKTSEMTYDRVVILQGDNSGTVYANGPYSDNSGFQFEILSEKPQQTVFNQEDINKLKVGDRIRIVGSDFYDNAKVTGVYPKTSDSTYDYVTMTQGGHSAAIYAGGPFSTPLQFEILSEKESPETQQAESKQNPNLPTSPDNLRVLEVGDVVKFNNLEFDPAQVIKIESGWVYFKRGDTKWFHPLTRTPTYKLLYKGVTPDSVKIGEVYWLIEEGEEPRQVVYAGKSTSECLHLVNILGTGGIRTGGYKVVYLNQLRRFDDYCNRVTDEQMQKAKVGDKFEGYYKGKWNEIIYTERCSATRYRFFEKSTGTTVTSSISDVRHIKPVINKPSQPVESPQVKETASKNISTERRCLDSEGVNLRLKLLELVLNTTTVPETVQDRVNKYWELIHYTKAEPESAAEKTV